MQRSSVPFGLVTVPTFIKEISPGMIVEAGSNGYQGGDRGCITYFRLQTMTGNAVSLTALDEHGEEESTTRCAGFEFAVEGDLERDDALAALQFIVSVLEEGKTNDRPEP